MLIVITVASLFLVLVLGFRLAPYYLEDLFIILAVFFSVALVMVLILLPVNRADSRVFIDEYSSFVDTLERARQHGDEYEIAAIQTEIVNINREIANAKYWRHSLWTNWFSDPGIENLEMVK